VSIPAKPIAASEGKPNGIPGNRTPSERSDAGWRGVIMGTRGNPNLKCRVLDQRFRFLLVVERQEYIDFVRVKTREAEIEVHLLNFLKLQGQCCFIPLCPFDGAVRHQSKCFGLRRRPLVAQDFGYLPKVI